MNRLFIRVFPELDRFPTPDDAKKAYRRATRQLLFSRQWWLGCMPLMFLFILAVTFAPELLSAHINRNTTLLWFPVISGFVIPICGVVVIWFQRRHLQRSLWRQLADLGIPCCVQCGYDLTGNVSGICPECGERI